MRNIRTKLQQMTARGSIGLVRIPVVIAGVILMAAASGAHARDRWQWDVSTYVWASSISEDLILNGDVVGGGDTSFNDLVDMTESSYQIHVETIGENIGFFVDAMSVDLSDQEVGPLLQTDVEITESVFDVEKLSAALCLC